MVSTHFNKITSNWIISPGKGQNKQCLKTPRSKLSNWGEHIHPSNRSYFTSFIYNWVLWAHLLHLKLNPGIWSHDDGTKFGENLLFNWRIWNGEAAVKLRQGVVGGPPTRLHMLRNHVFLSVSYRNKKSKGKDSWNSTSALLETKIAPENRPSFSRALLVLWRVVGGETVLLGFANFRWNQNPEIESGDYISPNKHEQTWRTSTIPFGGFNPFELFQLVRPKIGEKQLSWNNHISGW